MGAHIAPTHHDWRGAPTNRSIWLYQSIMQYR